MNDNISLFISHSILWLL